MHQHLSHYTIMHLSGWFKRCSLLPHWTVSFSMHHSLVLICNNNLSLLFAIFFFEFLVPKTTRQTTEVEPRGFCVRRAFSLMYQRAVLPLFACLMIRGSQRALEIRSTLTTFLPIQETLSSPVCLWPSITKGM